MFSNSTKYAIRSVLYLRKSAVGGQKIKVDQLSEKLNIPKPYLSKVLQILAKNRIISSSKGRNGGFFLSKENLERPLIDLILCMEGHNVFDKCIIGLEHCGDVNPCILHKYFKVFKKDVNQILEEIDLEHLELLI